jgi:CTP synthase (UTP-ammonia lyase)
MKWISRSRRILQGGHADYGISPDGTLPEIVEIPDHTWFVDVSSIPSSRVVR